MSDLDVHLPVHSFTGLTAIGLRRDGRPIWPVLGASPDHEGDGNDDTDADADQADEGGNEDKPLGPQGEKALQAEKDKRKAEAAKRRDAETERDKLKAQLEQLQKGDKKDDGPTADELKAQARKDAQAEVLRERVLDKVEAKAAKLFADPEDARALLAGQVDDFIDDGKTDVDAITKALEDLLKRKPHLAAQGARFSGSADGGARKGSGKPAQVTEQQLKTLSPDEIVKAREEGRLNDLMGAN